MPESFISEWQTAIEKDLGMTTLWTLQKCQNPETQYAQLYRL